MRYFLTILIFLGWFFFGYLLILYSLGSSLPRSNPVAIEIPQGASLKQIGSILQSKGVIRSSFFFPYYAFIKGKRNLKHGFYEIKTTEKIDQILEKLALGKQDLIKVVIPPGFNVIKIADRLSVNGINKKEFLYKLNTKKPFYPFEKNIKNTVSRKFKLEGYLYPGTYYLRKNADSQSVINTMLGRFQQQLINLNVYKIIRTSNVIPPNFTLDNIVTIASLVEKEGHIKSELPKIAGVIYNRLKNPKNNKLMIDASSIYIYSLRGINITNLSAKEIKSLDSPYNTYIYPGLPPGPICCPGRDSFLAALYPEKHNYEFYVTRKDGTRGHYFSRNYEEHLKREILSLENKKRQRH